ncbi:MAG: FAD-dependent oxidoreductase [Cyanobacteria bacterium]|nr:FAD-dependent oxidoreductase [Cyanobacteria bacterium bin.51]
MTGLRTDQVSAGRSFADGGADPVLVLGGGLIGLAIAHQLARRGESVQVLSRRRNEAAGFVAAGMLAPHAEGLEGAMLALGQRSLALLPQWVGQIEADSGLPCGLLRSGIVVPFATSAEREAYPTAALGEPLDRAELEAEIPGIGAGFGCGLLFAQDGQIDNRRQLMRALERACVERGVAFAEGTEVLELLSDSERVLRGVRLIGADGLVRSLPCRRAVLACGAWSASLLPGLPVVPIKGQMLSLQGPRRALRRVLFGPGTYLVPREDGLLVVGATSEPEAGFATGLTPRGQQQLEAGLTALLPEAASWPPMERWWGFRPGTPDRAPLLGPSPINGLWLATGHYRNGVLLAAITSHWLAALMGSQRGGAELGERSRSGGLTAADAALLASFHWDRFASPAEIAQGSTRHT